MRDFKIDISEKDGKHYADQLHISEALLIDLPDEKTGWHEVGHEHKSTDEIAKLGKTLFDSIFKGELRDAFNEAKGTQGSETNGGLRIRFITQYNVLNEIPFELLCADTKPREEFLSLDRDFSIVRSLRTGAPLATPVIELPIRMLVVIANYDLAGIDVEAEYDHLEAALKPLKERGGLIIKYLGVDDRFEANKEILLRELRTQANKNEPYHIFHFIGHGQLEQNPDGEDEGALEFVGPDGKAKLEYATLLASDVADFGVLFAGLQSCSGAKTADKNAFQGVAQRLLGEGLYAVIAMQWPVHKDEARTFFSKMYSSWLLENCELDRAVVEARKKVQSDFYGRNQAWINPVLFMNSATEALTFPPIPTQLTVSEDRGLTKRNWDDLVDYIHLKNAAIYLGPEAGALPPETKIAVGQYWAESRGFPYPPPKEIGDRCEGYLARVAQYLWVQGKSPKREMLDWLREHKDDHKALLDGVLGNLAKLPIAVYITTNYDELIEQALTLAGKPSEPLVCRWQDTSYSHSHDTIVPYYDLEPGFMPSPEHPIVFHFYGLAREECINSLVLTEDDYLDFLVNVSSGDFEPKLVDKSAHSKTLAPEGAHQSHAPWPHQIRDSLTEKHLLFLGCGYNDLSFRILLKSINKAVRANKKPKFVAVQLAPPPPENREEVKQNVEEYLDQLAGLNRVRVYWGTCEDFVVDLLKAWKEAGYEV